MRIYDTPTRWHEEPDIDPFKEEKLIELHGEDWRQVVKEQDEMYEFYNFEDAE